MRALRFLSVAVALVMALGGVATPAHASVQSDFISSLVKAAQQNQRDTGIPASVTIGMAALETGWGRSSMAKTPMNTLFNIKCTATKSKFQKGCSNVPSYEYTADGKRYLEVSGFRTYASTGDSLRDFGLLLTSLSRYAPAFQYRDNPNAFIREVHRAGYATDPRYTELVTGIMRTYDLYRYDVPGAEVPQLRIAKSAFDPQGFGAGNHNVKTLQRLLNVRTGSKLTVTGTYDWQTQQIVADYQYSTMRKQEISGDVDAATWKHLVRDVRQGDRGPLVEAAQYELADAGYVLGADGIFGAGTRAAVEDFQRRHQLPVSGTVDTDTWGKLLGL